MRIAVRLAVAFAVALLSGRQVQAVESKEGCMLPVALPAAVANARLVFLGEYHGTREAPLFAAEVACTMAQKGQRVTLALEMLQTEQSALDAYLAGDGGDAARQALLSTSFWRNTPDGRASTGTLAMIDRVRLLRNAGLKIDLLPLDGTTEGTRDETMAAKLRGAMQRDARRRFVFLAGNMHTRRASRGEGLDPGYESVAYLLRDQSSIALSVEPQSGTAWMCGSEHDCGPKMVGPQDGAEGRPVVITMGDGSRIGYDGIVLLPKTTAAEPAVESQKAKNPP